MDITMVVGLDITEDTMDGEDTMDTPTEDMDTVYWENALLMLNLKLMPKQPLRQMLMPGMVDIMDTEDTEDTMDGADTTDTPTDTDTVTWENAPLMPNPKLMPKLPLRLMPMPLPGIMVATMDTPTDMDTTVWDTVDTTDILITTWENDLLMLNPKLMPNPRLRLLPGTDTMVDTTVIPTDTDTTDIPTDMVVTGGNLSVAIPIQLV